MLLRGRRALVGVGLLAQNLAGVVRVEGGRAGSGIGGGVVVERHTAPRLEKRRGSQDEMVSELHSDQLRFEIVDLIDDQ